MVEPGAGTLNAAVVAASSGDTLFLKTGTYAMFGMVIDKSLTIKAQVNNTPTLIAQTNSSNIRLVTLGGTSDIDVTLSGLTLQDLHFNAAGGARVNLTMVESQLFSTTFGNTRPSALSTLKTLTLIGNSISAATSLTLDADKLIIAGNRFTLPAQISNAINLSATETSHFVGNYLLNPFIRATVSLVLARGQHFVLSNRLEVDAATGNSLQGVGFNMLRLSSSTMGSAEIRNNLFKFLLPATWQPNPLIPNDNKNVQSIRAIDINGIKMAVNIENNTFDYGMDADDIEFVQESPVIFLSTPATIRNNIVSNTSRPLVGFSGATAEGPSLIEFNLCDNVIANTCRGLSVVPGSVNYVDSTDFKLAAGSAAINAGKPNGVFNDVDGSRNDLGAYGGAFPIGQYDVQRTADRTEPYLYPLFEPNKSVTSGGQLDVRVIGLARSK